MELADLRDHDESLARDLEAVRQLDVAREDEHELVAGTEHVVLVHRAGGARVEHRRLLPEHAQAVDRAAGGVGGRLGHQGGVGAARFCEPLTLDRAGAVRRQVERGDGAEHAVAAALRRRRAGAAREVGVEHVLRIALGAEPRPHLVGRHPASGEPVAQLGDERGSRLCRIACASLAEGRPARCWAASGTGGRERTSRAAESGSRCREMYMAAGRGGTSSGHERGGPSAPAWTPATAVVEDLARSCCRWTTRVARRHQWIGSETPPAVGASQSKRPYLGMEGADNATGSRAIDRLRLRGCAPGTRHRADASSREQPYSRRSHDGATLASADWGRYVRRFRRRWCTLSQKEAPLWLRSRV